MMKVSDFQKCLRSLAEFISTKDPAKELTEAADPFTPFAQNKMEAFAEFLRLAEAKYGATGELPDGKPPKLTRVPTPKKQKPPKVPPPTVDELLTTVETLKVRLRTDRSLTKEGIALGFGRFEKLTSPDLADGIKRLGMQAKPKNKPDANAMIVNHTVSAQGGVERSDA